MLSSNDLLMELMLHLGMHPEQIKKIILTAPLRYKVFTIPKRDGSPRLVAQPAKEVKAIQRYLIGELKKVLPMHAVATAYNSACSIKKNAETHSNNSYILKMDFEDFFPSIKYADIINHLKKYASQKYNEDAICLLARACVWAPDRQPPLRLCIGAPSSPFLSNAILYDFDSIIDNFARQNNIAYTRYADDITFSCEKRNSLSLIHDYLLDQIESLEYPTLKVNKKKTVFSSRAGRRTVTGINITPNGELSTGRDRKRLVRAMYHRYLNNNLSEKQIEILNGLINFIESIEPGFSARLKK